MIYKGVGKYIVYLNNFFLIQKIKNLTGVRLYDILCFNSEQSGGLE